jgi:serine/threonine-protein kinase
MSPEQIEGQACDPRTDLYALGCIVFEMVTGAPPFQGATPAAIIAKHIGVAPAPLPTTLPVALRELVASLLAKQPDGRPASAMVVRAQLERAQRGDRSATASPRRRLRLLAMTVGATLAVAGVLGVQALMSQDDGTTIPPRAPAPATLAAPVSAPPPPTPPAPTPLPVTVEAPRDPAPAPVAEHRSLTVKRKTPAHAVTSSPHVVEPVTAKASESQPAPASTPDSAASSARDDDHVLLAPHTVSRPAP